VFRTINPADPEQALPAVPTMDSRPSVQLLGDEVPSLADFLPDLDQNFVLLF
jgi:hypothetical protein